MNVLETDYLVIGSGIAGLSFALRAAEQGNVLLITKENLETTNTFFAQGGIASVTYQPDNFEKHIRDTISAGSGLNRKDVVEMVVREAPEAIGDLIRWGIDFDKNINGEYQLGREGGHTENRIFHHKDNTGYEIQKTLENKVKEHHNIKVLENIFAVDILTQHHLGRKVKRSHADIECYGAYAMDTETNDIKTILSKFTVIATGGSGNVYQTTTNPQVATGDGIAMLYRAKGIIEHMEFIQFHPTSLYNPGERPSFLITEALRGAGGILKTRNGHEFMDKYNPMKSLAPRDVVARAIDSEMKKHGDDYVFLDCTRIDAHKLKHQFPNIYNKCLSLNINITKDMIPVVPAAHYQCGGIRVDKNGESSIHNLYAAGEVSSTGLHGANRLASNSLLEGVVYAKKIAQHTIPKLNKVQLNREIPVWRIHGTSHPKEWIMIEHNRKEIQQMMSNYVGIVRSDERLERAINRLEIIYKETEKLYNSSLLSRSLCELRNLINVSYLIIKMAIARNENIGLHYNIDNEER